MNSATISLDDYTLLLAKFSSALDLATAAMNELAAGEDWITLPDHILGKAMKLHDLVADTADDA